MGYEELYTPEHVDCLAMNDVNVPPKEDFTCNKCPEAGGCEFAWDLYNTHGDCLADK